LFLVNIRLKTGSKCTKCSIDLLYSCSIGSRVELFDCVQSGMSFIHGLGAVIHRLPGTAFICGRMDKRRTMPCEMCER
jgi:hypothetical protein